jgi:hypothetical protein
MTMIGASHGAAHPGPPRVWADDVLVALAPSPSYARLIDRSRPTTWHQALRKPALVLLITGTSLAIAATGRVTIVLVASTMVASSFAIVVQLAAAAMLVAARRSRQLSRAAAIDLAFAGHVPWSVWVLGVGAWAAADIAFSLPALALTFTVPLVWNAVILAAFCREVLGATPRGAWLWTLAHQGVVWSFGVSFVAWISGGWFRLVNP